MRLAKKNAPLDVQPITGRTRRAKNKRQCRERQNTATPPASSEQAQPTQDSGKKDGGKKDGDKANTGNVVRVVIFGLSISYSPLSQNVEWAPPADSGNNWDNGGNWGANLIKVATDAVCGASGATGIPSSPSYYRRLTSRS